MTETNNCVQLGNGTQQCATRLVCLRHTRAATSCKEGFAHPFLSYHSYAVRRQSLSFFAPRRTDGHLFKDDAALKSVAKKKEKNAHRYRVPSPSHARQS